MATILNNPGCGSVVTNTGTPNCAFMPDKIIGAILVPESLTLENSELDTFITTMQTKMLGASGTRVYPIFRFDAITDNSEDLTIRTLGYGGKQVTKDPKYDWTFEMLHGGHCHNVNLRKFNKNKSFRVLFVDELNYVYGVKAPDDGMKGFTMDFFYAMPFKANTGEEAAKYMVRFALAKPNEWNEDVAYFTPGVDVEDALKGILDVELVDLGAGSATKKHIVGIRTACDKVSLYDAYSTLIATEFAVVFTATKLGVAANPTAAVAVPAVKGWELTFDAVGSHIVTMGTPAALAAKDIGGPPDVGYEASGTLAITVA